MIMSVLLRILFGLVLLAAPIAGGADAHIKIAKGQDLEASLRVAFCLVGAPRGLVKPSLVAGLPNNLLQTQLLGLAPRLEGIELTIFALLHTNDEMRERWDVKKRSYEENEVVATLQGIVANEVHLKIGRMEFNRDAVRLFGRPATSSFYFLSMSGQLFRRELILEVLNLLPPFIRSFMHPFIHSFIHSFIHPFV
jgi:hypothetical protein